MRNWSKRDRGPEMVSASEIGEFVYCPEAWRLEHALRRPAGNQAAGDAGSRHHARKALAERVAGGLIGIGLALIAVPVVLVLLLWMVWR